VSDCDNDNDDGDGECGMNEEDIEDIEDEKIWI